MWASILFRGELFIGTLNPRAYKCIFEAYCPSQFATKFGLTQGIPVHLCSLSNSDLAIEELKVSKTKFDEATLILITDLDEFEFSHFIPQGNALKRYQNWWTTNMKAHLAISPKDLLKGLDVSSQVQPKETGIIITSFTAPTTPIPAPSASSPPPRITRATLKKGICQSSGKEQTKEIIVFQRSKKRRQQQILREEATIAVAIQKETTRKSKTAEHYALRSSPTITITIIETGNFP
ncbi:hypothetical protein CsSME_00038544 [Camellia sinensis var. sinensis]